MICYLVRHGQDDDTVRGGWGNSELTETGIEQVNALSTYIFDNNNALKIRKVYSSDLLRAKQTAQIIAENNNLSVKFLPQFREVNNGKLASMDNITAEIKFPGMYWRRLSFDEHYPNGESPREFYKRISNAWQDFCIEIKKNDDNVILVTHAGVIEIILNIVKHEEYTNKVNKYTTEPAKLIKVEI